MKSIIFEASESDMATRSPSGIKGTSAWIASRMACSCNLTASTYDEPNGVLYPETKNNTLLDLADPAWQGHFQRFKCFNASNPSQYKDTKFCDGGGDKCSKPNCPQELKIETYECVCDACVFQETLSYLSPVTRLLI